MVFLRCKEPMVILERDLQLNVQSEPQEVKFYHQKDTSLTPQQPTGFKSVLTTLTMRQTEAKLAQPLSGL